MTAQELLVVTYVFGAVAGLATIAAACYLRIIMGKPFTQVIEASELPSAIKTHSYNRRVITCIAKLPDGTIVISGR
jgi:hypothetical protein